MRTAFAATLALCACDAAPAGTTDEGVPDPFAAGKSDEPSSLVMAWDPPRTLTLGQPLPDQALALSLRFDEPEVTREESVEEDGTINIDIVVDAKGELVYEVGRYFLDLDRDHAQLYLRATPEDPRFETLWWIGRPGEEGLTTYEGDEVILDRAWRGRYRIAVLAGKTPTLEGTFRYTIEAAK